MRDDLICINISVSIQLDTKVVPLSTEIIIPYTYKYYRGDAPNWFQVFGTAYKTWPWSSTAARSTGFLISLPYGRLDAWSLIISVNKQ